MSLHIFSSMKFSHSFSVCLFVCLEDVRGEIERRQRRRRRSVRAPASKKGRARETSLDLPLFPCLAVSCFRHHSRSCSYFSSEFFFQKKILGNVGWLDAFHRTKWVFIVRHYINEYSYVSNSDNTNQKKAEEKKVERKRNSLRFGILRRNN